MASEGPFKQSGIMRAVRRAHTKPEVHVHTAMHALGLSFGLHAKSLQGLPDIVLEKHHAVIFVHGCFWHRHPDCKYATLPKTRQEF